jgi:ribosomal protein L7Ae-like RNA K-turn-binding protein
LNRDKALSFLGLANKAGKVVSGEFMTAKAVKEGKAYLVIVSLDASENTKKKFRNMCDYYQVPIHFYRDKISLGKAIGKEFRASLGILDQGFADGIIQRMVIESGGVR